jgi:protein-tyrosine phosphatase
LQYTGNFLIDLHSHILPGVDDGASSLADSFAMARMAVADGIEVMACTPHFMLGVYDNTAFETRQRIASLNQHLAEEGIPLALVTGSDAHIRPDFLQCLRDGNILTLHDSRYVLFEPPHNILPPRLEDLLFNISVAGYVPILTHPERLKWIEQSYETFQSLVKAGVWMQITSGSLTGRFGKRPQYWSKRMLAEGMVSILATDAHNVRSRPPLLSEGFDVVVSEIGREEAEHLVFTRPLGVLEDRHPNELPALRRLATQEKKKVSWWRKITGDKA